jgi:hypothetical protein
MCCYLVRVTLGVNYGETYGSDTTATEANKFDAYSFGM